MRPYGLILAGGGAKGAYQIGAWKALIELGIQIEAIAGTSIGAINGAFIAQGDFDKALEVWEEAEVVNGIKIDSELKSTENLFSFSNFPQLFHEIVKNGGVDVSPARQMIADSIDEDTVRRSNIPLGIVSFQLGGMKPVEVFIDEMPEGSLVDYLMASARFPGLNRQGPDDSNYLDGGIYDNAPVGMLRKRGLNRLIIVDISNIKGMGHKEDLSCADLIYIRPFEPKDLGASFEFDKEMNEKRMRMGYYDTLKAFGKIAGRDYYFSHKEYKTMLSLYGFDACEQLEGLARELEIPRLRMYTHKQFMRALTAAEKKSKKEKEREKEKAKAKEQETENAQTEENEREIGEVIANFVPSIIQEKARRFKDKIKEYEKSHSSYKSAYEALDKFNS